MAGFDIGSVIAKIDADISGFKKGLKEAKQEATGFGSHLKNIGSGIADVSKQAMLFTGVVTTGLVAFGKVSVDAFNESEAAVAQLGAVLKSTGGAAGMSKDELIGLSKELQKTTTFSDEAALGAENLLLTFTNIGKDIFPQATKTVADMSVALGQDLKSSSIQLGKALQDPVLGITALRRVGVNFSDAQKDVIEKLVNTGHSLDAQKMILKELNTEFGGSAAAAASTYGGKIEQLKNQFNDFQEKIGGIITAIGEFAVMGDKANLAKALGLQENDPIITTLVKIRDAFVQFGDWLVANKDLVITALQGIAIGIGALMVIGTITALVMALTNPLVLLVAAITALYTAWQTNFLGIQDITMSVINTISFFFNTYLLPILTAFSTWLSTVFAPAVNAVWTGIIMPIFMNFVKWFTDNWTNIKNMIQGIWQIITGIIQLAWSLISGYLTLGLQLLSGNWKGAWQTIQDIANNNWKAIQNILNGGLQFLKGIGGMILDALVKPFRDAWNAIQDIMNKIKDALDFTKRHSPSVLDIVKRGVGLVNDTLGELAWGGSINAHAAGLAVSNGGAQSNTTIVQISMDGAMIADAYGANQMAEILGDSIIKRLQNQVRF